MAKITVGPVIGKVTHNTGRILLEVDDDTSVTCIATPKKGKSVQQTKNFKRNRPSAFHLQGLRASTRYQLEFKIGRAHATRTGTLTTFEPNPQKMNLAAVSCNFTIKRGDTNLWEDMYQRYVQPGEIHMLLHLGDQVYGDSMFAQACNMLEGKKHISKSEQENILQNYRQLYRWSWNDPATREVLARVPSLMIWDDHEIRDDWGSKKEDRSNGNGEESIELRIGRLARQVFREYQRQLWDDFDPDREPVSSLEHHAHRWGPIGVLLLDLRGGRSFGFDPARPYLSAEQWRDIRKALLGRSGIFSAPAVRALVVVSSVPLVFLSGFIAGVGSQKMDDLRDHWSYAPHRKEQVEMIRLLRYWKQKEKNREVFVLGGDVHIGGYTDIRYRDQSIFKQLITSPITNRPPRWYEFYGVRALMETHQGLGDRYSFEHSNFTHHRNYGVVLVRTSKEKGTGIVGGLEEAVN